VHAVKGLEFNYVFLTGLEERLFPHSNSLYQESEIEEERRLCYVAITRAREKLYITNARTRILFGMDQINPVSRFISEIDDELLDISEKKIEGFVKKSVKKEETVPKVFNTETSDSNYQKDDYVYHDVFGTGKVLSVEKSIIKVAFKMPYGIKTLMKNHKSLRKV